MSDLVHFDVGGEVFITSLATLNQHPDSFLTKLATTEQLQSRTDRGLFVDRPSQHFKKILSFMQTGRIDVPDVKELAAIQHEADFYCLNSLASELQKLSLCGKCGQLKTEGDRTLCAHHPGERGLVVVERVEQPTLCPEEHAVNVYTPGFPCPVCGEPVNRRRGLLKIRKEVLGWTCCNALDIDAPPCTRVVH
eukprot:TRINITY_DN67931_c6_g1_i1.p1 TRINITY_DN67931_c6_g1~~TRINITY_DN67931_c6_g1_i1.p1  ORF type:complete len:193 (-),score=2.71 TRINITY_DN67931_c6_g1_i1:152-730(-)